jgi:surfeit locus 1 family protein
MVLFGGKVRLQLVPSIAYLLLLPILLALANWQYDRAQQKQQLLAAIEKNSAAESIYIDDLAIIAMPKSRYKKIQLTGKYDQQHQFLLDNQIHEGKAGYFVITPLILENSQQIVLVNRGWLPANPDRTVLPSVAIHSEVTKVAGRINQFPSLGIKLPGSELTSATWPSVIQVIDAEIISKKLAHPVQPFQVELDGDQPDGYKRDWQTAKDMLPEQHIAYAIQWLALAVTLTLLFIWNSFKTPR